MTRFTFTTIAVSALLVTGLVVSCGTGSAKTSEISGQREFRFAYRLQLEGLPNDAENLQILIPVPIDDQYQAVSELTVDAPFSYREYHDPEYGNKILDLSVTGPLPDRVEIGIDFNVVRREVNGTASSTGSDRPVRPAAARYLQPDLLVPIDGPIAEEARLIVSDDMTAYQKVTALYDHLFETMKYDKSGTGWGNGDALYACDSRRGNCTDIHSLFIGMARASGVPARFIIGFPLPADKDSGEIAGYHCWAEFYLDDRGWLPVDISEAIKNPEKKEYYFGRLDPNRVSFTTGRDIQIETLNGQTRLNYFVYPYVLIDGKVFENVQYSFSFSPS